MVSSKPKARLHSGFTLVEVLVALFIIGIAIPALLSQVMGQVDGTAILRDKTVAYWVAEERLAELKLRQITSEQAFKGRDSGKTEMAGRSWEWRVVSEERQSVIGKVIRYDITVGTEEGGDLVTLVGLADG